MSKERIENIEKRVGLFKNVPRFLKTAVRRRLKALESDAAAFDRAALTGRPQLKRLCALLHLKPGPRAQQSLFAKAPEGSPLAALRRIASSRDEAEAAALVRAHRLPYVMVEAALGRLTADVALALVETLDDAELLNRLRSMARRELLTGPLRDALLARLEAMAAAPPTLSYHKAESIARLAKLDRECSAALFRLVRSEGEVGDALSGATAILVDASPSMERVGGCLELAAQVGALIDGALAEDEALSVLSFGQAARAIAVPRRSDIGVWRRALTLPAGLAGSAAGLAYEEMARQSIPASRVVVVTDGFENRAPRLTSAIKAARAAGRASPGLCLVQPHTGGRQLAVDLRAEQIPFAIFQVDPHRIGLDALIPTLRGVRARDEYAEICRTALPGEG